MTAGLIPSPAAPRYVSCDPAGLYRDGGFPGPPEELAQLLAAGPGARALGELYPPFAYRRVPRTGLVLGDPGFRAELVMMQRHAVEDRARGAASGLYRIEDAILRDDVVHVVRDDGVAVLYETHRPADRVALTLAPAAELLSAPTQAAAGPHLFFSSSGAFNYGHWLVDDLPRLKAVAWLRRLHPGQPITLVLTAQHMLIDHVRERTIERLMDGARDVRLRFVRRDEILRLPALYYASPVSLHPALKSPDALRELAGTLRERTWFLRLKLEVERAAAALVGGRLPRPRRRLFVERSPRRTRTLSNGDAVFRVLEPLGFERVDPDGLSFARQLATFTGADFVVGSMGAAMTNTLFCPPGTPTLYLAPEGWVETFYWDLAAVMGHRYHALYGPPAVASDAFSGPFAVDPDRLARMVRRLLRRGG